MSKVPQRALDEMKPEKSRQITSALIELGKLGRVETDEQVRQRISEFFYICSESGIRPGIETLALALGVSRKTVFAWGTGRGCSPYRQELILRAKSLITSYVEQGLLTGATNPVSAIFALKNYAGWKDSISIEANTTFDTEKRMIDKSEIAKQLGLKEGDLEQIETDDL